MSNFISGKSENLKKMSAWWIGEGLVVGSAVPFLKDTNTYRKMKDEDKYSNPLVGASWLEKQMGEQYFPGELLPFLDTDLGPGSLAVYLGCEPKTLGETVWFYSPYNSKSEIPDVLEFDKNNIWWKRTVELYKTLKHNCEESFLIPFPDLSENLDTLASIRGSENLMLEMIDDPLWVKEKIEQIDECSKTVIKELAPYVQRKDGSTSFHAFRLYGEGITAKVQCDASALISREMFDEFVVPSLTQQCQFLDNSLFHLDGTQCIHHLDSLLQIEELTAVEWTPQAGIETGEDPRWYPMYRKILDSGKSLQVLVGGLENVTTLLKEFGTDGIYLLSILEYEDYLKMLDIISPYLI